MTAPVLPRPPAWVVDALCAQVDNDLFFPEKGGSTREAKKLCGLCEVKAECLEFALDNEERYGIWGGLSERERRSLRTRPQRPAAAPVRERAPRGIDHGTDAGWRAHRRLGGDVCRDCATAHDRVDQPATVVPLADGVPDPEPVSPPARRWTRAEIDQAVGLLTDYGMSAAEIADELGIAARTVHRIRGRRSAA